MIDIEEKEIELAKRAYLREIDRLHNQYHPRRCTKCGEEIVPGKTVWVPWRSNGEDEIYCSAECYGS